VTDTLTRAVKEAIIITIVVVIVAMVVNFTRDEGIPLIADAEAFRIQTNADFIVAADAEGYFNEGRGIFLDAREERLYAVEHIEGALNLPSTPDGVDEMAYMVPADPVLICYSAEATEREAGVIADKLLEIGFTKVFVLHGGLESWKALGLPTGRGE
jgi:rhodanese-related sulfurtransferase